MNEGKPKDQALAISYAVRKRAKKMAKGGEVKGVHERTGPEYLEGGMSKAGLEARQAVHPAIKDHPVGKESLEESKRLHKEKLEEMRSMPKPKLQGLARGGIVQGKSFKVRPVNEIDAEQEKHLRAQAEDVSMEHGMRPEEDMVQHPEGLESDNDEMSPPEEEFMAKKMASGGYTDKPDTGWGKIIFKADGGEISPEDEIKNDEESSIAAAIMARKRMAEGGVVDNNEEESADPSPYDDRNEAVMKENYDQDLVNIDQPTGSNEHGHTLSDEDEHDGSLVSKIMAKRRRSAMTR